MGNFLSICVLVMSFRKKGSSVYLYLAAVAICDTLFICLNGVVTANPNLFDWATHCHLFGPGMFILTQVSGLFIMMMTVNRFLAVYAPFKSKEWQTKKITCIIIAIVIAIVLAVNWFWFGGIQRVDEAGLPSSHFWDHCQGKTELIKYYHYDIYPWLDLCIYLLVPSAVMLLLNPGILIKLHFESKKGIIAMKARGGVAESTAAHTKSSAVSKSASRDRNSGRHDPKSIDHDPKSVNADPKSINDDPKSIHANRTSIDANSKPMNTTESSDNTKSCANTAISNPHMEASTPEVKIQLPETSQEIKNEENKTQETNEDESDHQDNENQGTENKDDINAINISIISGTETSRIENSRANSKKWRAKVKKDDNKKVPKISNQNVRLTVICLVLSCSFLLLVAPVTIFNLIVLIHSSAGIPPPLSPIAEDAYQEVAMILLNLNHSINFILYCVTSQAFRKDLKAMLCPKKK